MKKLFKILAVLAAVAAVLLIAALITLKIMFPPEKLKAMAQDYAQKSLGREIAFTDVSFNLIGLTLDNFALSEKGTFADGTFVKADKAVVKVALKPLFQKRVEIGTVGLDGLNVYVSKQKNGQFNFDDLIQPADETQQPQTQAAAPAESSAAFAVSAEHIYAKNCNFYYKDLQTGFDAALSNVNLDIKDFSLDAPFSVDLAFTTAYKDNTGLTAALPVKMALKADLAALDMAKAQATLNSLTLTYKNIKFTAQGGVKNLNAPLIDLSGKISGVSNAALADIAPDLPAFTLPDILFSASAEADLDKSSALLKLAKLSLADSAITARGTAGWGETNPTYNINADINLNLAQIAQMADMLSGFGMGGLMTGGLTATDKKDGQDVRGTISLQKLAVAYDPLTLADMTGDIVLKSLGDVSCASLTGLLNGEKFTSSFAYKDLGAVLDLLFHFDLEKLTLDHFPSFDQTPAESADEAQPQPAAASSAPETLFNVRADVKVGEIKVPYFTTQGVRLSADLKKASASMQNTSGKVNFELKEGAVTDLDSFVKESKIVKIIMLPLTLVKTVTSKLGVDIFPAQNAQDKGKIKFTVGEGEYVFTDGVMDIAKTRFDSAVSNMKASGNINFKTEALDMRVTATVLTSQTPIVVKIGGTMTNPSGKLDVAKTAASLITGILSPKTPVKAAGAAAETAGNTVKGVVNAGTGAAKTTVNTAADVVKGIGSLFKKKDSAQNEKANQ